MFPQLPAPHGSTLKLAVLMTCHNRRPLTIRCLTSLYAAAEATIGKATWEAYLVDDGCTDGTADEVTRLFPAVRIIPGSGNMYWCGGMRHAWQIAAASHYHAYLWLNDDVVLRTDALAVLCETMDRQITDCGRAGIVVGSTAEHGRDIPSYGERTRSNVIPPGTQPRPIRLFNGNIVLVSDVAFRLLGNLSSAYSHSFGDIDYGIRAARRGVPVWLAPGYLGHCSTNGRPKWKRPDVPLITRFFELHRPTGCPPWELAFLMWQDRAWWAPYSIAKLYGQVLFPPALES